MKLKLFFLGMVAAALMISCNNEIDEGRTHDNGGIVPSTGQVSYFSFKLPSSSSVNTRAGALDALGTDWESQIYGDCAVFVYEWNGVSATPEAYAYMPDSYASGTPVTLKVTDGTKKIYVALNLGVPGSTLLANLGATATTPPTDGEIWPIAFSGASGLNQVNWTPDNAGGAFWSTTPPSAGVAHKVDSLLRGLTGSQFDGGTPNGVGLIRFTDPLLVTGQQPNAYLVMSNWDNNRVDSVESGASYESTCIFTLEPNVPLDTAFAGIRNSFGITVQRAVARASFNIGVTPSGNGYITVPDITNSLSVGRFTPWRSVAGTYRGDWVLGNINNETTIFQRFISASGAVMDSKTAPVLISNPLWYQHYDNTRFYGNGLYGTMKVHEADSVMNIPGNASQIGVLYFQYLTENSQHYWTPAKQDNTTYIAIGGKYDPEKWVSAVFRAQVPSPTTPGYVYLNDYTGPGNTSGTIYDTGITPYFPVPFPTDGSGNFAPTGTDADTLYYYVKDEIFIYGRDNVLKYFAWFEQPIEIPDGGMMVAPQDSQVVVDYFNAKATPAPGVANPELVAYWGGQCFYRAWLRNPNLLSPPPGDLPNEEFLVRRNHIYNVNVTRFTGPGIGDPNRIILEDEDVGASPTYMAVEITIQQWHRIEDNIELGGQ